MLPSCWRGSKYKMGLGRPFLVWHGKVSEKMWEGNESKQQSESYEDDPGFRGDWLTSLSKPCKKLPCSISDTISSVATGNEWHFGASVFHLLWISDKDLAWVLWSQVCHFPSESTEEQCQETASSSSIIVPTTAKESRLAAKWPPSH